jgi:hypothetical protein
VRVVSPLGSFLLAAARAQAALEDASRELQRMLEAINTDRAARGQPPLDVTITVPGT